MSKEQQQQVLEYIEYLYEQATALKQYIDALQKRLTDISEAIESIRASKQALQELQKEGGEFLLFGDRRGNIVFKVGNIDKQKVLIHIGLEYYAEVEPSYAQKILDEREQELNGVYNSIQTELSKSIDAYNQIVSVLSQFQKGE